MSRSVLKRHRDGRRTYRSRFKLRFWPSGGEVYSEHFGSRGKRLHTVLSRSGGVDDGGQFSLGNLRTLLQRLKRIERLAYADGLFDGKVIGRIEAEDAALEAEKRPGGIGWKEADTK